MTSRRNWLVEPLALKLFVCVAVLVLGVLLPGGYFVASQHLRSSLELKRTETYLQGRVIAMALEHQMLENRRDLIRKMIEGFSSDPRMKRLLVVDHTGRVRLTNDPSFADRIFSRDSPACQVCHVVPGARRATSAVIELEGGTVLRSVFPFRNQPACQRCHDPANTINGVMIADTDMTDMRAELQGQIKWTAAVIGIGALILLAGMTLTVRVLVLRRLERIEATTRAMAGGDFTGRVADIAGTDAVARLGREFNGMADSVADLLAQLGRQRTQLENVMGSVDDGLLVVDRTFSVVAVNKSLAERIGLGREDLLYRRCSDIWPQPCDCTADGHNAECPARACFETGTLHKSVRMRYAADGTLREEEVFASPIVDGSGVVEQVVEVWRDITERKSREARMAEFQRMVSLGMLAAGFSHEVNTPLGTMLVHLDEVRRTCAAGTTGSPLDQRLDVIRGEILRCKGMTQQFLQLSRGQSIHNELLELPAIVQATLPLVDHIASNAGVRLRVVPDASTPIAYANGGAVRQVVLNILLNAVQASRPGGEVRVTWRSNAESAVRIEDDGVGMAPEVREQVFEPFFSRQPSGTGLGLFVSLNLVRQWGGDIRVASVPDQGSVFEVTFPAAEDACRSTVC